MRIATLATHTEMARRNRWEVVMCMAHWTL